MAAESYIVGMAGFLLYIVLFIGLLRLRLSVGWFALEIIAGFLVHLLSTIAGYLCLDGFSYWYSTAAYAFLWFCFFFVSSIYSVSVSLGIISYLYKQPEKAASLTKIYEQCIVADFQGRVDFLVMTKQAQKVERGYIATPTGKQTVQRLRMLHSILGMKNRGLYAVDPEQIEIKEIL